MVFKIIDVGQILLSPKARSLIGKTPTLHVEVAGSSPAGSTIKGRWQSGRMRWFAKSLYENIVGSNPTLPKSYVVEWYTR